MQRILVRALCCLLAVLVVTSPAAHAKGHGSKATLLGRYYINLKYRSDLDRASAVCYDSDRSVPIYLVRNVNGGTGRAHSKLAYGRCTTRIELERGWYRKATVHGKAFMRRHELDHLLGYSHSEASTRTPDHDGKRERGESAARDATLPVYTGTFKQPVY